MPSNSVHADNNSFTRDSSRGDNPSDDGGRSEGRLYAPIVSNIELPAVQRDHFVGSNSINVICQFIDTLIFGLRDWTPQATNPS